MNGFDAQSAPGSRRWPALMATIVSLAAVSAVCLAIYQGTKASSANAQAPIRQAARPAAPAAAPVRSTAATPAAPATKTLQVMAVINGEQITRAELGRECMRRYGEEVLESLVNRQLIVEACRARNVTITEQDVDAEIDRISAKFGLSRDRWVTLLKEERGYTEEQYRREVVWPMLALRTLAAEKLVVTQDELKRAFESEFGPKVRARMIAVATKQKADEVYAQAVANPAAFGELAKLHCEDPSVASAYGVIPPIRRHLGDANLEQVAFNLKPGQVSHVVQVANKYYILKCEEQIPQQYVSSQQLADYQKQLSDKIRENKLRAAASQFFDDMQKQAQVVNVLNDAEKQKQLPGVAATVNGKPISLQQLSEECVVRFGEEVLEGEINRKVLQQELNRKKMVITEQDIDQEVARAADSYGYLTKDGKPDVDRWLKSITEQEGATVDLYVRDAVWPSVALKKLVGGSVKVTEEDLLKGFESNYGERVEVLAVVIGDHRQAQKVWEMARNNPTDNFFAELAQQYSIEPASRSNGGKVPPIRKHGGSPLIEEEAFRLQQGELSGIVALENQFVIMRCLGRTRPVQVDYAAVKHLIHKDIQEKKLRGLMTTEFDRLRESSQVDNFLAGTTQAGRQARPTAGATIAPAGGIQSRGPVGAVSPATATGAPATTTGTRRILQQR